MLVLGSMAVRRHSGLQTCRGGPVITISTAPAAPLFGGGTANIAFLLGNPTASSPNTQAVKMEAQFWIEAVEFSIDVPVFEPGQPPLTIPAVAGVGAAGRAGSRVPREPARPGQGTAHDQGHGAPDPVRTAGLPELQRTDLATRVGGHARVGRPLPVPASAWA
jgi:hypothetical protein